MRYITFEIHTFVTVKQKFKSLNLKSGVSTIGIHKVW